ncbi:hypothetical protein EVAR_33916_1 [Eumeta japonica]|uniref:Uncharacterized protein n=1 Tax=Eumeta variegata TaxID=151549 RepID=A0A4C1VW42_EUMVA|nr:hypothetical protein EVAR_33916_1 [Eumeta japonica]
MHDCSLEGVRYGVDNKQTITLNELPHVGAAGRAGRWAPSRPSALRPLPGNEQSGRDSTPDPHFRPANGWLMCELRHPLSPPPHRRPLAGAFAPRVTSLKCFSRLTRVAALTANDRSTRLFGTAFFSFHSFLGLQL